MIADRCGPLNEGELDTVRMVMTVSEAVALREALRLTLPKLISPYHPLTSLFHALGCAERPR